jgi:starch synthase
VKILFMAAEADPFVGMGGLGDVAGALPLAHRRLAALPKQSGSTQVNVRLVIPLSDAIKRKTFSLLALQFFDLPSINGPVRAEALNTDLHDIPGYLIAADLIVAGSHSLTQP